MKSVEELCTDDDCKRRGSHWHPLSIESLLSEEDGEYTLTVRVRTTDRHGRKAKRAAVRRT